MVDYKKTALLKFTSIYFFSTAFFIIILGYLYYHQQENIILQKHTMKMHQYTKILKQTNLNYKQEGYSFEIVDNEKFQYKLAIKYNEHYRKSFPYDNKKFIVIKVRNNIIDMELYKIKTFTIIGQILLLLLFFGISLLLAKLSLKPMNDTISHLDRFIKDLIHDLNTPATTILLNTNMLKKQTDDVNINKKLDRIQKSADAISSLYENLEIILKDTLEKSNIDIFPILEETKELLNFKYPNVTIDIERKSMPIHSNEKAIRRIIDNILSNSCKYSTSDPLILITFNNNKLTIKDNGKGIKYPHKIFERSYSEDENGHGIGMHIVQRLCNNLDIKIDIDSKIGIGTTITLHFSH
ncbi:MAG: HAMP domain-containing sensor histidine kinase [Campylobacterota bacterium]|nr:HAMP domain-containing sensor histidine kinase [Campylobacterota bacterium]